MAAVSLRSRWIWCVSIWLLLGQISNVLAATVQYDFNVTWLWTSPDGVSPRPVIGINQKWPLPTIEATVGDTVLVNVLNSLGNQSTSFHFHGLFMNGTSNMDGTSYVSQCAITPGSRFTYNFTVQQSGTYWYHSHEKSQYPDGLRGLLVVHDPQSPYRSQYDEELVLSVSDWYTTPVSEILQKWDHDARKSTHDPVPDVNLINDTSSLNIHVQPGKTYLVRLVNIGALASQYFWIENHEMTIIEADGIYVEPVKTDMIHLASGQRYNFLLHTEKSAVKNFAMVSRVDMSSFSSMHGSRPADVDAVGWLVYNDASPREKPKSVAKLNALDDLKLIPLDQMPLLSDVDHSLTINVEMRKTADKVSHWLFNKVNYERPKLPSLFAALTSGENATDPAIYEVSSQPFVLNHNEVIEINMRNRHMRPHPIHLHGHNFQVIYRTGDNMTEGVDPAIPPRRDTVVVNPHGNLTIRFRADNPGVWLFHCHMEWHVHSGLVATIVEAPVELQQQYGASQLKLKLDRHRTCDALELEDEVDNDTGSSEPDASKEQLGNWRLPGMQLVGAAIVLAFILSLACAYFWYRRRRQVRDDGQYNLVPVHHVDDLESDEDDDGFSADKSRH